MNQIPVPLFLPCLSRLNELEKHIFATPAPTTAHPATLLLRGAMRLLYIAPAWSARDGRFIQRAIKTEQHQGRSEKFMTRAETDSETARGMEAVLLANREKLIRFLAARGAGNHAEDMFQELWVQIAVTRTGPVANPLPYLFRAANNLMLDRYRSARAAELREKAWGEQDSGRVQPSAERSLISREELERVEATINGLGERPAAAFHLFRIDGMSQRDIAARLGVSLSTVEADLRKVYAALAALKGQIDE